MNTLLHDIKFSVRQLSAKPLFTAMVVLSLGLAIAANTTIFSFMNELLYRPAPVKNPRELWQVWRHNSGAESILQRYGVFSYPEVVFLREHDQSFDKLAVFDPDTPFVSWNRDGLGELIQCQFVSGNFFDVCELTFPLGRAFYPDEDQMPGTHPVTVLSHRFWEHGFDSDPEIIGKTVTLNGVSLTVIGVAPPEFTGLIAGLAPDCWVPFMMAPSVLHDAERLEQNGSYYLLLVGRLKPEITPKQAEAQFSLVLRQLEENDPKQYKNIGAAVIPASMIPTPFRGYVQAFSSVLMGAVLLVLLIACANAAHLLFARAVSRRQEMATRASLGATRTRLIRQLLTESILLAFLSGCTGLALTCWFIPVLLSLVPSTLPIRLDIGLDKNVFLFTALLSIMTGILFGLVPAWYGTRDCLSAIIKNNSQTALPRRSKFNGMLIAGQIAVCFVLLIGGTLCLRSLMNAQSVDTGFQIHNRITAKINLNDFGYTIEESKIFYRNLQERIASLPGFDSVAMANHLPLGTDTTVQNLHIDGYETQNGQDEIFVQHFDIGTGYFSTMGTVLLQGREFTEQDREDTQKVVIINEEMAKRFWQNENPIGKRIRSGENNSEYEIVGVVQTGKYRHLGEEPRMVVFYHLAQHSHSQQTLVAHIQGDAASAMAAVRNVVRELDPRIALTRLGTLEEHLALTLFPVRTTGFLLSVFGIAGLLLAISGLFGVIAYSVSQRTREIGIRVALGAQYQDVLNMVMRQGMMMTAVGLVLGMAGAIAASRFLQSYLFGISPTDPLTFVVITLLLALIAFLACYIPARRAANVDPMTALRCE